MTTLLLLIALGALVGVDGTTVGQTMVSRPFVAGVLAGALTGDPVFGAGLGAVLELFSLVALPSGGSRLDEMGLAAVAAVGAVVLLDGSGRLPIGVGFGLAVSTLGGSSVHRLREWNGRRWERAEAAGLTPARVARIHWVSLALDAMRAALIVAVLVPLGRFVLPPLVSSWPLDAPTTRLLLLVAAAMHAGVLLRTWGGWRLRRLTFLGGVLTGLALGLFA